MNKGDIKKMQYDNKIKLERNIKEKGIRRELILRKKKHNEQ